jgi:hypothetical protein
VPGGTATFFGRCGILAVDLFKIICVERAQTEVCATQRLTSGGTPRGIFSELHILKDFKYCVLKLRILQGLEGSFGEVRILNGIVASWE